MRKYLVLLPIFVLFLTGCADESKYIACKKFVYCDHQAHSWDYCFNVQEVEAPEVRYKIYRIGNEWFFEGHPDAPFNSPEKMAAGLEDLVGLNYFRCYVGD